MASFTVHQRWVIGLTSVASFMVALDLLVVSTALPTIKNELDASLGLVQWAVTGYGLAFAVLLPVGAALGDRFGRRRVFVAGLALFASASAACALSSGIEFLIAARVAQGAGAAVVMPLAVALLSSEMSDDRRGRALGLFEGLTGLATIAGPPVGGIVAYFVGWEWIFWVNVPIAVMLIPLTRRLADSRGPDTALDLGGIVLVTGGCLGVVWALVTGNESGWTSAEVVVPLVLGVVLTGLFIGWERRAATPMLPLRLFRRRTFSASAVVSLLLYAALYGTVFFLSQYLQIGRGYTALESGLRLIPWTATLLVVAPLAGAMADRFGNRPVLVLGLALKTVGLGWLSLVATPDTSYAALLLPLIVEGIGTSMAIPVVQSAMLGAVPPDDIGKASGVNGVSQEVGGVLGIAVLVALFAAAGSHLSPGEFVSGFVVVAAACAVFSAAAAIMAATMGTGEREERFVEATTAC